MSTYKLPYFEEEIYLNEPEEYYDTVMPFQGRDIDLDINTDGKSISIRQLQDVEKMISNLMAVDATVHKALKEDFENGDTVKEYVAFHLEQADLAVELLLNDLDQTSSREEQLAAKLYLTRIGFYPENDDKSFATFDYTIGEEITQYLVVVEVSKTGEVTYITMES